MPTIFKNFRRITLGGGRLGKYLVYAIGEIVLVVIGILFALQINEYNEERKNREKEHLYLAEIHSNLEQDDERLDDVAEFNEKKMVMIQELLKVFSDTLTNQDRVNILMTNLPNFSQFESFTPKQTAFRNLISAESINLISSKNVRNQIIDYYEMNYQKTQERVWIVNRRIIDEHYHKFVFKEFLDFSNDLPPISNLQIHQDTELFTDLYGMMEIVKGQNAFLDYTQANNNQLIKAIDKQLKIRE